MIVLSEHEEQTLFVTETHYEFRNRSDFCEVLFFAVVNGFWAAGEGGRKIGLLNKYREEGWRKGIADVQYQQPRGGYAFAVFEMKRSDMKTKKDGGLSPEQKEYLSAAKAAGAFVRVCYGADEAMSAMREYMSFEADAAGAFGGVRVLPEGV